ncbi:amidohydrolase [Chitinophaga filiformis]|uniref:Amidohydrolase n=1 Tax=Chitinophaga filiformis TaxID=104663 RepID=A0ABY4HXS8_CHIFI|nr:amidohydrolase [Chitinophaga filiformis]UPK67261.1 amidohydrolase [Chitinophaga filiformis]
MEHHHHHGCAHCACSNPILNILKDQLFTPENFAKLPKQKTFKKEEQTQPFMVTGGIIRPMINGAVESIGAIGFAEGVVVKTGTKEEVAAFMDDAYPGYASRILEEGQTLLPGLIEPHIHLVPTAMLMGWTNLDAFEGQVLKPDYNIDTLGKIIAKEAKKLASLDPTLWFLGSGLDPALMPLLKNNKELLTIDIDLLDSITTDAPVCIIAASMHTLYVNTKALWLIWNFPGNIDLLNTYSSFNDYKEQTKGQLQESAGMTPALKAIPPSQKADFFLKSFLYLKQIFDTANSRGVTFMHDAGMNKGQQEILEAYLAVNKGTVRIGAAEVCNSMDDLSKIKDFPVPPTVYKDIYKSHVKVITDGSNQGLTGYQSDPYLCNPAHNYGVYNFADKYDDKPLIPPKDFRQLMQEIVKVKQWPVMIHANGDRAVQFAIDAFKEFIPDPSSGVRHRIEHCSLATQQNLIDMKNLGVSPSFLIGHVGYWGYAFQEAIFGEKSNMLDLCNSALQQGMRITLHSDNSVSPLGPLRMMEQSITRKMEANDEAGVLNGAECITHEQALRAITYDAAWQCYAEQWTGSLKAGNFADFVVLAQDPLTMKNPFMNMRNIEVVETWVAGVKVYSTVLEEAGMV